MIAGAIPVAAGLVAIGLADERVRSTGSDLVADLLSDVASHLLISLQLFLVPAITVRHGYFIAPQLPLAGCTPVMLSVFALM